MQPAQMRENMHESLLTTGTYHRTLYICLAPIGNNYTRTEGCLIHVHINEGMYSIVVVHWLFT
jgi:hypothetical protein